MAPNGPMLPRKATALARTRGSFESAAFQVGVIVAIQRNRHGLTQRELASAIGIKQTDVSAIESGYPAGIADSKIDALFRHIDLPHGGVHANYLKWWRDNSTL